MLKQAFGASSARVRPVFATMGGQTMIWGLDEWVNYGVDPGVTSRPATPLATPNAPHYAGAVSSYMWAYFGDPTTIAATKAGGVDGIMARLNGDLLSDSASIGSGVMATCAAYGTLAMIYEGGFENFNQQNYVNDPVMVDLSIAASRDLRIGPTATHELQVAANYYDLFMWFSHTSVPTSGGQ